MQNYNKLSQTLKLLSLDLDKVYISDSNVHKNFYKKFNMNYHWQAIFYLIEYRLKLWSNVAKIKAVKFKMINESNYFENILTI